MCGKSIVVCALMTRSGEQESWCSLLATDATPSSSPLLWAASSAAGGGWWEEKTHGGRQWCGTQHNAIRRPPAPLCAAISSARGAKGGRRKQGTPWIPLTPTYRKPALFLCYIVLLKTKQSLAQCVRNNRAQCVGHNTLQGQPAVTEQSNWDRTME